MKIFLSRGLKFVVILAVRLISINIYANSYFFCPYKNKGRA